MFDENAAISSMVRSYNESLKKRSSLLWKISEAGKQLEALGKACQEHVASIEITQQGLSVPIEDWTVDKTSRLTAETNLDDLSEMLRQLSEVDAEKDRIDECLRQVGLERIIRE